MFHHRQIVMCSVQFFRDLLFISCEPVKQRWNALQNTYGISLNLGAKAFRMHSQVEAHHLDVVMLPEVFQKRRRSQASAAPTWSRILGRKKQGALH